ncbi:MAG: alcohol dehydrogenase catalytic domain-containing protein [Terriglobia bacterium]
MKAIVFDGTLNVSELPRPVASGREALIRVLQAGICNTDIEITRGYHQFQGILGHEFVGIVEQAADPHWLGRRIVGEINCVCHQCDLCRRGLEKHCRNRSVLGIVNRPGALAEFCTLPMENLHEVPEEISNDEAVFVEPLAAAFEILEQVDLRPEDRLCIVGDGKLAQLIVRVLAHQGGSLTVIGKHQGKLDQMVGCGAEVLLLESMNRDAKPLAGTFDVVVEAAGSPQGFQMALTLVRPRGTLVLKSTYHDRLIFDAAPLVVNEIRVVGSRCGPFPRALEKLRRREVDVRPLVSDRYPLVQGRAAFKRARESGTLKILVSMGATGQGI